MKLTRKEFLQATAGALGTTALAMGCGDSGSGGAGGESSGGSPATGGAPTSGGSPGTGGTGEGGAAPEGCTETIATNHGHVLEVTQADIDAAADKTYDIQGSSAHTHTVTITAADFATLGGGGQIEVTSSETLHTHVVTVMCA